MALNPTPEDLDDEQDQRVVFLSSCLAEINQLQATEPRDRIYGLQALYTDLGIELPPVDYSKPLSRVYEGAAVAMIMWSRTLKILGHACHDHGSLPSWVPDYSDDTIRSSTPSGDATGGFKVTASSVKALNPRPGELSIRGKIVGKVKAWKGGKANTIFPTRPDQYDLGILMSPIKGVVEEVDTLRLMIAQIQFFRHLYHLLQRNSEYCDGDADDAFLDILKQDTYSEPSHIFKIWLDILQYPKTKFNLKNGEDLAAKWQNADPAGAAKWTAELTSCAIIAASLVSEIRYEGRLLDSTLDILDMVSQLSANLNHKALMLVHLDALKTTTLVTGAASVQEGDAVVLLEGAEWPVVLREVGVGKWRFFGPAFVPGIMDGELWPDGSREAGKKTEFRDFCLV